MKKLDTYAVQDLHKEIKEKQEALRKFRFGSAGSRARNVREGRTLRQDIARLITELKKREIAETQKNG